MVATTVAELITSLFTDALNSVQPMNAIKLSKYIVDELGKIRERFLKISYTLFRSQAIGGAQEECRRARWQTDISQTQKSEDEATAGGISTAQGTPHHPTEFPLSKYAGNPDEVTQGIINAQTSNPPIAVKLNAGQLKLNLMFDHPTKPMNPFDSRDDYAKAGKKGNRFDPTDYHDCGECWLCGITVYAFSSTDNNRRKIQTACGECEHVCAFIPSAMAGMLAKSRNRGIDGYQFSYRPSCYECNQYKSKMVGVKISENGWEVDNDGIEQIAYIMWGRPGMAKKSKNLETNPFRRLLNHAINADGAWIRTKMDLNASGGISGNRVFAGNQAWFNTRIKAMTDVITEWVNVANYIVKNYNIATGTALLTATPFTITKTTILNKLTFFTRQLFNDAQRGTTIIPGGKKGGANLVLTPLKVQEDIYFEYYDFTEIGLKEGDLDVSDEEEEEDSSSSSSSSISSSSISSSGVKRKHIGGSHSMIKKQRRTEFQPELEWRHYAPTEDAGDDDDSIILADGAEKTHEEDYAAYNEHIKDEMKELIKHLYNNKDLLFSLTSTPAHSPTPELANLKENLSRRAFDWGIHVDPVSTFTKYSPKGVGFGVGSPGGGGKKKKK